MQSQTMSSRSLPIVDCQLPICVFQVRSLNKVPLPLRLKVKPRAVERAVVRNRQLSMTSIGNPAYSLLDYSRSFAAR
jgi:hypothetical protein